MNIEEAINILQGIKDGTACLMKDMPKRGEIAIDMAINALSEQHWIPITERLPKQYQEVLICGGQDTIKCAQLIGNIFECDEVDLYGSIDGSRVIDADMFNVLAWMPLPEVYQPKGDGNEQIHN